MVEMTELIFVRHGEIEANVDKRWHGSTDSELNKQGTNQALKVGRYFGENNLRIAKIYSSPLKRTLDTAQAIGDRLGITPETHVGLREYGIGVLEDTLYESLGSDHQFFEKIAADHNYTPDQGESLNGVCDRFTQALLQIKQNHPEERIVIVSHGAAMAIAFAKILKGSPFPFFDYHMSNTGVTHLDWLSEPVIRDFDNVTHLQ